MATIPKSLSCAELKERIQILWDDETEVSRELIETRHEYNTCKKDRTFYTHTTGSKNTIIQEQVRKNLERAKTKIARLESICENLHAQRTHLEEILSSKL